MTPAERAQLIERYVSGVNAAMAALGCFEADEIDAAPSGEWSARQIAHHLADTELFRSTRLRSLLAEDAPFIESYDESQLAVCLHYERPIEASVSLIRAATETNLALLSCLPERDWLRSGMHADFGPFSVEAWLQRAANHGYEHAAQLKGLLPHD